MLEVGSYGGVFYHIEGVASLGFQEQWTLIERIDPSMEEALYCIELPAEFFFYRIAVLEEVDQGGNSTIDPTPVDYGPLRLDKCCLRDSVVITWTGILRMFSAFLMRPPSWGLDGA